VSSAPEMQPDVQRMMAAFSELADALARTNLHFNTIEGPNRLTARLGVSDLAPLNDLFPLVMKSMQAFSSARPRPRPRPARTTPVRQSRPPITTSPSGAVRPSPAQRAAAQAAASRASRQWLQLADDGRYADCWNDLAAAGRRISTQQKFGAELKASRAPLGKVISRKLLAYSWGHSGGKIDSFQFTYRTSFQGAPKATESVSARRQRDGRWLVSNYRVDAGKVQDQSSRASNAGAPPGPRG